MQTICFHSMVKDEENHIGPLLASVKKALGKQLTYWVIADTGSTDKTKQIIEEALKDIPGEIVDIPWEGFGASRTLGIEKCRGKADYILIADADYSIIKEDDLPELTADCYLGAFEGAISWRLPMLLKDGIDWFWDGRIHEVLYAKQQYTREPIDALKYAHRATEEELDESLERNLKELLADWKEVPSPRTAFYLGNTYCDMGDIDKSAYYYQRRIEMGDASDEVFFSQYQKSRQLKDVDGLLVAHHMGNHRVEPLYWLACIYRERGMYDPALLFAEKALTLELVDDDTMFMDLHVYKFGVPYEFGVAAYNIPERQNDGILIFDYLLGLDDLPDVMRKSIHKIRGTDDGSADK